MEIWVDVCAVRYKKINKNLKWCSFNKFDFFSEVCEVNNVFSDFSTLNKQPPNVVWRSQSKRPKHVKTVLARKWGWGNGWAMGVWKLEPCKCRNALKLVKQSTPFNGPYLSFKRCFAACVCTQPVWTWAFLGVSTHQAWRPRYQFFKTRHQSALLVTLLWRSTLCPGSFLRVYVFPSSFSPQDNVFCSLRKMFSHFLNKNWSAR